MPGRAEVMIDEREANGELGEGGDGGGGDGGGEIARRVGAAQQRHRRHARCADEEQKAGRAKASKKGEERDTSTKKQPNKTQ